MEDLTNKADGAVPPDGNLPSDEWNQLPEEVQRLIVQWGIALSSADLTSLAASIKAEASAGDYYEASGGNNYVTLTTPGGREPMRNANIVDGTRVRFYPTAASTSQFIGIYLDGGALRQVRLEDDTLPPVGAFSPNRFVECVWQNITWRIMTRSMDSITTFHFPPNHMRGFATKVVGGHINIDNGECRDASNSVNIVFNTGQWSKYTLTTFGLGDGFVGFPHNQITYTYDKQYYFFVVMKDDGTIDFGWDEADDANNLLTEFNALDGPGWLYYRRILYVRANPTVPNHEYLETYSWPSSPRRHDFVNHKVALVDASPGTLGFNVVLGETPPDVLAILKVTYEGAGASDAYVSMGMGAVTLTPPSNGHHHVMAPGGDKISQTVHVPCNGSSQIRIECSDDSPIRIEQMGWFDNAGAE